MNIHGKLVTLRSAIERLQEAELRPDADNVIKATEEHLSYLFDDIHECVANVVVEEQVDINLLESLLAALALNASTHTKCLIRLDLKEAAEHRSRNTCGKLLQLAFIMPRDVMAKRLEGGAEQAAVVSQNCSEIRLRMASQPHLIQTLIAQGIHGRDFIERIEAEDDEPMLILPTNA